jgi:hypothetical protein
MIFTVPFDVVLTFPVVHGFFAMPQKSSGKRNWIKRVLKANYLKPRNKRGKEYENPKGIISPNIKCIQV